MAGIIRTLPGVQGTLGQPTAQVIDGSLKFDSASSQYLKSTSTFQNTKSYEMTFSFWLKRSATTGQKETQYVFSSNVEGTMFFDNGNSDQLGFNLRGSSGSNFFTYTEAKLRDYNSWYHIVVALNLGSGTQSQRFKCYINGVQQTMTNTSYPSNAYHTGGTWYIGAYQGGPSHHPDYRLTNFYCISGQVLDPTYFGFTDPLTNTWKPKKYTGTFTFDNSFYLPMDGNSRIGKDMSGSENDWTPINFNGSVPLDSDIITGGRPILNTNQGGAQAGVGVFGSLENKFYTVSSSSGGGNPYIFDNEGTQPTFNFIRGATYRFDYTSATSHPLRFATAADAAGSSQYTTGTNTSVSNVITITVPHDAPDTLYYYCTNHSGMGNSISVTTDETKADKYASNIVLAVPMAGSSTDFSGSINATQTSKAFSNNAGTTYTSEFSNFYSGSGDFTNSSDVKRIDYTTSGNAFGFGTDDFTIEWWMYATANADGNHYVWDTTGQKSSLIRKSGGGMTFETLGSSNAIGEVTILSSGSYNLNKWAYWAVVRDGDNVRVYIDGVLKQKTTGFSGVNFGDADGDIGGYHGGNAVYNADAYIQDFRIYKGVAKYTGTSVDTQYFTVPSRSPDILPDTPSGVSGGSKLTKVTDGAVSFDGANDYLTIPDSDDFNLGSGAFTIEGFCYLRSSSAQQFLVGMWTGNQLSYAVQTSNDANRYLRFLISDDGTGVDFDKVSTGSLGLNGWSHFAVTRSGNTFYLFVDGILVGTQSGSQTLHNSTGTLAIGARNDGTQDLNGFISNLRIVKGTALYTSNFTPPTAPLTNVTNTKLLCCQDLTEFKNGAQPILNTNATGITTTSGTRVDPYASSLVFALPLNGSNGGTVFTDQHAIIKGSGSAKSVEVTGNTQTSTTQSKYYGSSGYFDGTGDYLTLLDSSDFAFGSGDFTIEAWIYITDLSGTRTISGQANSGGGGASYGHFLEVLSDGRVNGGGYNPGDNYINVTTTTSDALVVNRWYHIAMVRNGNDLNLHINGVIKATSSVSGKSFTDSSNSFAIGRPGEYNGSYMYGYIQDYRVYKGTAKYTSNVNVTAPSVEPAAAVSPSSIVAAGNATVTNFNPFNTDINTVRGQETGYPTLNPLIIDASNHLSENNLKIATTSNFWEQATSTIGVKSGKWYWEVLFVGTNTLIGATTLPNIDGGYMGQFTGSYGRDQGGGYYVNGSNGSGFISWSSGSTIGVALDMDNGEISVYPNGIYESPFATNLDTSQVHYAGVSVYGNTSNTINFGQKPFKFPPPDGFQPLNAANTRPETVIARPDQYVDVSLYTGNSSSQRVGGLNMSPDFVWLKSRSHTYDHYLTDTVRGATKSLRSNTTAAEDTLTQGLTSFNSDGFSVGNEGQFNNTGRTMVAWCWRAGGSKNTFNVDDEGFANASNVNMSVGALNGSAYNTDQIWSGLISPASGSFDQAATLAFNGIIKDSDPNRLRTSGNNILVTMTFSTSVSVSSQVRVHSEPGYKSTCTITVDGVTYTSEKVPIHTFNVVGSLTQMTLVTNEGSSRTYMSGMEVDGKQLVDSNITAPSVPGIAPTGCSVGTKQGFSIIKYTGSGSATSIPHGLLKAPEFVLVKNLANYNWAAWHKGLNDGRYYLFLNNADSQSNNYYTFWNDSTPTPSVINLGADSSGTNVNANQSGVSHICYSWHSVPGLQKFGSYIGNGNADGPYVELGFSPSLIILRNASAGGNWFIYDATRDSNNPSKNYLRPNLDSIEYTISDGLDILSNGFKMRQNSASHNGSDNTIIYAAWAKAPSVDLYGGGANAR